MPDLFWAGPKALSKVSRKGGLDGLLLVFQGKRAIHTKSKLIPPDGIRRREFLSPSRIFCDIS